MNDLLRSFLSLWIIGYFCPSCAQLPPVSNPHARISLEKNWHIQSACKVNDGGAAISRVGYNVREWLPTTVLHTVMGAQVDAKLFPDPFFGMNLRAIPGMTYPIGKVFANLPMPEDSPYKCSWWYRSEFHLPADLHGKNIWLHFDGINYRANIWVNGKQIATSEQVAGAYRTYEFNVKDVARAGAENALAVEVFAQTETDLGINFVDWNPAPADKAMGLWRPVYITSSGSVSVRYPSVSTHFSDDSLKTAELTVTADLQNDTDQPISGNAEASLEGLGSIQQQVTLAPGERQTIVFTPEQFPQLRVQNPKLWWPYPLGLQNLYKVEVRFRGPSVSHPDRTSIDEKPSASNSVILRPDVGRRISRNESDLVAARVALPPESLPAWRKSLATGDSVLNLAGDPSRQGAQDDRSNGDRHSASGRRPEQPVPGDVTDRATAHFGIREITAEKTPEGHELFRINRRKILVRGGGWSYDMFVRTNPERMEDEFRHVRNLGLNTIRLEGKIETDEFFDMADRYGILIMAGWCCCDHWEHWPKWKAEDHEIAKASLASQVQRLRNHPSLLVWLYGSDSPPPADVESEYLAVLKQYRWPNPSISSASAAPTTVTGESGVKMSGPYDYVPPSYWLRDPGKHGGAWGFNTETSPGPAPVTLASLQKFIPKTNLWPHDDVWNFHAGGGSFAQTNIFDNAMAVTYGPPTSAADYEKKSQAMTYDGERAMFEAYARNKYNSTGVIQWMLNNAWPSVIWHLYDYYLVPGGGYFGAKKANEVVHAQYSYDDRSVVVVNSLYEPQKGLKLRARVLDKDAKTRFERIENVDLESDSVSQVLTIPDIKDAGALYFVRLDLSDSAGKMLSTNLYWLPAQPEELDWDKSNWYMTPAKYADMTALASLPPANVEWKSETERHNDDEIVRLHLHNWGGSIAFLVRADLKHARDNAEIAPVLWDDNYITLLPGESRTLRATVKARDLRAGTPLVSVEGWNVKATTR